MVTVLSQHKKWLPCSLIIIVAVLELAIGNTDTCNNIPDVENAKGNSSFTPPLPVNTVLRYYCNPGYETTEGMVTATCKLVENSPTWVISDSRCRHKTCGFPGEVRNARRIGEDFRFGKSVKYECFPGYEIRGLSKLHCDVNGKWHTRLPKCIIISCGHPPKLGNGSVSYRDVTYQSIATYSCNGSFRFVGSTNNTFTRQCLANKTWSGTMPVCQEISCQVPSSDSGVTFYHGGTDDKYKLGTQIYYTCAGEDLPSKFIECTALGTWSKTTCKEVFCPDLPIRPGIIIYHVAEHEKGKHAIGEIISFTCGNTRRNRSFTKCTTDGTWSELPGECEVITPVTAKTTLMPTLPTLPEYTEGEDKTNKSNDSSSPDKKIVPVGLIVGIVTGVVVLIGIIIGTVVLFHKKKNSSVPGNKKKASPNDAVNMDEIQRLEKNHRPIPVTVL